MNARQYVEKEIADYHTNNIRELIDYHDISIQYSDELNKQCDSSLIIINKTAFITIKTDLDPLYENFLLAHELGHYLMHYDDNISFSYLLRTRKRALEREANEFACRLLLEDMDLKDIENMEFVIKEKGIPLKIWYSIQEQFFNS